MGKTNLKLENAPIVGVTATHYTEPKEVRFQLAKKTVEAWRKAGLPLIVADTSPKSWVVDELADRGAIICPKPSPGLATQYIDGVNFALKNGAKKILTAEPEKIDLAKFALDPISHSLEHSDIVVVGRTLKSMRSLPTYQAKIEEATALVFEKFGYPPDVMSGIRAYSKEGAKVFVKYDADKYGNNWVRLHEPLVRARKKGLKITGVLIDLIYPQEVRDQEQDNPAFDMKRLDQSLIHLQWLLKQEGYKISFPV